MRKEFVLSQYQQTMVEDHLHIVRAILRFRICPNESSTGLGFDDLYQEGCLWLRRAAYSYAKETASFPTYAKKVVTNGLLSYCREVSNYNKHFTRLEIGECGELILPAAEVSLTKKYFLPAEFEGLVPYFLNVDSKHDNWRK